MPRAKACGIIHCVNRNTGSEKGRFPIASCVTVLPSFIEQGDKDNEKTAAAEYVIATATGGIEGMPTFDDNAPGNEGWHIVKVMENGVESLKVFWRLGMTLIIR